MVVYILKFSACLLLLLAFYKLFLERENMHHFKRFYLLSALIIAIVIPLITFTTYVESDIGLNLTQAQLSNENSISNVPVEATNYTPIILWSIYGLGVLVFLTKFLVNLSNLIIKIKRNPKYKSQNFINVLLQDLITPHTFLSYIFLNKSKFENQEIPDEVLLHEQTHAKQKHSLDILFVEVLQILFWFNPLIYLIKNSIKLNHEFLADEAVLKKGVETNTYQQILLAFSAKNNEPQLANAINYSSIKKRFTVMKTQTSKTTTWIRGFILLPLLAFMVYGFSSTKEIIKPSENPLDTSSNYSARSIDINILDDGTYTIDGISANKNSLATVVNKLHQDITPEIRNDIMNIHLTSSKKISNEEVWFIYNSLLDYGFYRLVAPEQEVVKGKGNTPFANSETKENQDGASRELMKEYNKLAKHYNSMPEGKRIIKQKDVVRMKYIYGLMSDKQRKDAEPMPNIPPPPPPPKAKAAPKVIEVEEVMPPPPPPIPENATEEEKRRYKKIIENYAKEHPESVSLVRKSPSGEMIEIVEVPTSELPPPPLRQNATDAEKKEYYEAMKKYKVSVQEAKIADVKRLKETKAAYRVANAAQLKERKAELAKVRELRSEEEAMKLKERMVMKDKVAEKRILEKAERVQVRELRAEEMKMRKKEKELYQKEREKKIKEQKGEIAKVRELKSREEALRLKEEKIAYSKAQKAKLAEEEMRLREIKTPKPPKSPLDHIIEMAKKGAVFYLEGKKISSDKAISTLKKNKHLNVESTGSDSKEPKVYITKDPIVIGSRKKQ